MTLSGHPKVLSHQLPFSRSPSHLSLHLTLPRAAAGPAQGPPRWHHTEELPWLGSGAMKAAAGVVGKIRASWLPCGRPSLAQHSTAQLCGRRGACSCVQHRVAGAPRHVLPHLDWEALLIGISCPAHCSPSSGHAKQDNFSSPLSVCGKDPLRKA